MDLSPFKSLVEEHLVWLSLFRGRFGKDWRRLLKANPEAALAEAKARRVLEENGCSVSPNDDRVKGGADFRCEIGDQEFLVECTVISLPKSERKSGLSEEREVGSCFYNPLNDAVRQKAITKAGQFKEVDKPLVLIVGSFHFEAGVLSVSSGHVARMLLGSMSHAGPHDPDSPYERYEGSLFLDREGSVFTPTRRNISAVLFNAMGAVESPRLGVLHPDAEHPFDPHLLPEEEFYCFPLWPDKLEVAKHSSEDT